MKKSTISFAFVGLLLAGLSLTLSACRDNDLADGGNGGSTDSTTTEIYTQQQAKKYDALQSLLGVTAELDSLPENWDEKAFTVEPTLGEIVDAAQPYVRYVATTSVGEANRIYRSMTSTKVEAKVSDDTWQVEGVGTMKFKVQNEADCYATLDVSVQQLPHLQQLRFVPASAVGDNGAPKDDPFYQIGDVICQQKNGQDPAYWVCVRPCSKAAKVSKSHWCTLQLTPYGSSGANYKKLTKNKCGDLYLPTGLCKDQGDGERMVQNYFNVLRVMHDPSIYNKETVMGIGEITKKSGELTPEKVRDLNYMWSDLGIWDKIANTTVAASLKSELSKENPRLNAFYYGYSKVLLGNGDYRVYNLELSNNNERQEDGDLPENSGLFNEAEKQTLWLQFDNNEKNFKNFENKAGDSHIVLYEGKVSRNCSEQQYMVKYKTGAQLEENLVYTTDNTPGQSFEERGNNYGLTDVLSYTRLLDKKVTETGDLPFFALGDEVLGKNDGVQYICIKDAFGDAQNKGTAYFLRKYCTKGENHGTQLTEKQAIYIACHLLNAYYYREVGKPIVELEKESTVYRKLLMNLYDTFSETNNKGVNEKGVKFEQDKNGNYVMTARFYTEMTNKRPTFVELKYNPNDNIIYSSTFDLLGTGIDQTTDLVWVSTYTDDHTYTETFSKGLRTYSATGEARRQLKQNSFSALNESFNKLLKSKK